MDPTAVCGHLSLCRPPVSPWIHGRVPVRQESAGSVRGPAGEDGGQWGTSPALTKGAGFSGTVWRQQRGTSRAAMDEPRPLGKSGGLGFAFHSFRGTRRDSCFWGHVTCWAPLCLCPRFVICFVCIISIFAAEARLLCHGLSAPTETTRRLQIRDAGGTWLRRLLANGDFPSVSQAAFEWRRQGASLDSRPR